LVLFLLACQPEAEPIRYGKDACDYCRMQITDQRYGAEMVTKTGKVYKFDAIECLINYSLNEDHDNTKTKMMLVNTFDKPGELLPVQGCVFLHSKEMPSPMGMYLTAFHDPDSAHSVWEEQGGYVWKWDVLQNKFQKLPAF